MFYSMVLTKPMPSIPRYIKYINVNPKLCLLQAPYIKNTVAIKKKIYAYNHKGFWLDIGRVDDYEYANQNFSTLKKIL